MKAASTSSNNAGQKSSSNADSDVLDTHGPPLVAQIEPSLCLSKQSSDPENLMFSPRMKR